MRLALELVALALIVLGLFKAYDDLYRATHEIDDDELDERDLADVLLLPCAWEAALHRTQRFLR